MGYQTRYDLSDNSADVVELASDISEYDLSCMGFGISDDIKWYDHDRDMKKVSEAFPDTLITLRGEGEDSGDIWTTYYLNGKMQRCKAVIAFEEFNPEKLQEIK